jgi:hypothetical protein
MFLCKVTIWSGLLRIIAFLLALQFALLRLGQPRHQGLNSCRGKLKFKKNKKNRLGQPRHQSLHGMNNKDEDLEENQYKNKILNFILEKFKTG